MRRYKLITEQPWNQIVNEEWARAKILRGYGFKKMKKFKFYWDRSMERRTHGQCWQKRGVIFINHRYQEHKDVENNYEDRSVVKSFRGTVRHEIAHIGTKRHDSDFKRVLKVLDGTRHATCRFEK